MLGTSFDGALPVIGTLVGVEVSHHFNWPVQIFSDIVIETALSPIRNPTSSPQYQSWHLPIYSATPTSCCSPWSMARSLLSPSEPSAHCYVRWRLCD